MDDKTKEWLEKRVRIIFKQIERTGLINIEEIADNFKFENRKSNLEECLPYYKSGNFCLDGNTSEKYCLLCSCPNYDNSVNEGGCLAGNPCGKGYYYDRTNIGLGEIWDCSDCNYPHSREATMNTLNIVKEKVLDGENLNEFLWKVFSGKLIKEACAED